MKLVKLVLMLAVAVSLVGCGGDEKSKSSSKESENGDEQDVREATQGDPRIEKGMTYEEVKEVRGSEGKKVRKVSLGAKAREKSGIPADAKPEDITAYSWYLANGPLAVDAIVVAFYQGKVVFSIKVELKR